MASTGFLPVNRVTSVFSADITEGSLETHSLDRAEEQHTTFPEHIGHQIAFQREYD